MHGKIDTCIFYQPVNVNKPFIFLINVRQFFQEYFVRRVGFVCKLSHKNACLDIILYRLKLLLMHLYHSTSMCMASVMLQYNVTT